MMNPLCLEYISLSEIVLSDMTYRISRPGPAVKLQESVAKCGVADPVILLRDDGRWIPVSGHNRLSAASAAGCGSVRSIILESFDPELFLHHAAVKIFRGELGCVGRLRALSILRERSDYTAAFLCSALELPADAPDHMLKLLLLDERILSYCDSKNVPYRTLASLEGFPDDVKAVLALWIESTTVRMNIFKVAVELLADLLRGNDASVITAGIGSSCGGADDELLSALYALRNPVISSMNVKAGEIAAEMKRHGVDIVFPQYFEGNSVECRIRIMRKDEGEAFRKSLSYLSGRTYGEILSLL